MPHASAASPRHLLTLDGLGLGGLASLLDLTRRLKRDPEDFRDRLAGGRIGMIFDKPSTRTRVSFESAAWMLGMLPIVLRPDELQLGRGETIADTARALSLYLDGLTVRTFAQAAVEELAAAASIPVINALTNEHHPCQALADVLTLEEEFGTLAGIQVAFVGDGDNVCHSLIQAAALAGFELRVATPPGYEPSEAIIASARDEALVTGGSIILTHDQGQIGYLIAQALATQFAMEGRRRPIAVVLSQTVVDRDDPAFRGPSKPIGPMYDEATARQLASRYAWTVAPDGPGWRRVVPSPIPLEIVESASVATLAASGAIVIASGGGGIPVGRDPSGALIGVEAVVDKDLAAVVLAESLDADALLLLTDVDAVHLRWGSPDPQPIRRLTIADADAGVEDGTFAAGSMGPKVKAAAGFVRRTGRFAAIGVLGDAVSVLHGRSGTVVVNEALVRA